MNKEPRYLRYARGFMSMFTPEGMDSLILGVGLGLFAGILLIYWWFQL